MRPDVVDWLGQHMPHGIALAIAPSWFMCVGLSGLVMLVWMVLAARRRSIDTGLIANAVLWSYLAAVVAGIVVPATIDTVTRLITTGQFRVRWAGMTSFWGYLAGFVAVALVCRNKLSLARFGDIAAAPLGLSLAFARLGCYLGGCDYGKVTSVPWAVRFPAGSPAWKDQIRAGLLPADRLESLPVHPTQLYEAALGLVIVGVTLWIARRTWAREGTGRVFLAFAATYAIGRIGIETLRGDLGRGIYFGLSSGQIFSLCVLVAIAAGLLFARRRAIVAIATAASLLVILVGDLHPAYAQPAGPMQPQPQPQPMVSSAAPDPDRPPTSHLKAGMLIGFVAPLNRRENQVPALAGGTLSIGYATPIVGIWLDFDSYANRDAAHGTVLLTGSIGGHLNPKLFIGGRLGVGATLVNFDEPAFQDVGGTTTRFEAMIELAVSRSILVWVRPLSIDILTAADLGGPITTYQMRLGAAYQFGFGGKRSSRPRPEPYQSAPPAAYPQQQQPGGYPQQQQPGAQVPPGVQPFYTPGGAPYYPQGQQPYYPPQPLQPQPYPQPYPPQGSPYPAPAPPPAAAPPPAPTPVPTPKPKAPKAKPVDPNQVNL